MRFSLISAIVSWLVAAAPGVAQQYSSNFSTGPGRATLYGDAVIESESVRLTPDFPFRGGAMVLDTSANGARGFVADFTYTFIAPTALSVADGMSFNLGVIPSGTIPVLAENGPGNGLTVQFLLHDFNHDGDRGDAGINVLLNGVIIASAPGAINLANDLDHPLQMHIELGLDHKLNITCNSRPIVTNLSVAFSPRAGQRFGFAARTGGLSAEQRIDNVIIRPYLQEGSCSSSAAIAGDGIWGYSFDTATSPTEGSSCVNSTRDVWFCWKAAIDGLTTISTVALSDDDTVLAIYDGCGPCPQGFGPIVCNDDIYGSSSPVRQSEVTFPARAGSTYGIRLAIYSLNGPPAGDTGADAFSISTVPTPTFCPADFNHSGTRNVQDIFDFLTAWFGSC